MQCRSRSRSRSRLNGIWLDQSSVHWTPCTSHHPWAIHPIHTVLENYTLIVALAYSLRFNAVCTCWPFLSALYASLSASYKQKQNGSLVNHTSSCSGVYHICPSCAILERVRNSVAYLSNLFWFFSARPLQPRPHSMELLCYSRHPRCRVVIPLHSALLNLTRWCQLLREESSRRLIVVVVRVDVAGRRNQFHQLH